MSDFIITVATILMLLALIPTAMNDNKPPLVTSLLTVAGLFTVACVFLAEGFYGSAVLTSLSCLTWAYIAGSTRKEQP